MPATHRRVLSSIRTDIRRSLPRLSGGQRDDLLGGLVHRLGGVHVRQRGLLQQAPSLDVVGAVEAHDERNRRFDLLERRDQAVGDLVAAGDAAEDVEQHRLDRVVGQQQIDGLLDLLGVRASARVEEVGGRAARLGDDVERRHHQAGAVAEDADVAVELDVLDALFLGAPLDRVFVLAVRQRLVLRMAVQRVAVERDLRVERLDLALGRDDQRVYLRERRILLQPHLIQRDERVGDAVDHVRVGLAVGGDLHGLLAREADQRVDVMADQLLRRLLGDLFDVDAALDAEHHQRLLGRAVEQHRGVVLGGDVRGVLDPQRAHGVSMDVHPEDVAARARAPRPRSAASLTPPALPRPPIRTCALTTTG